LRSSKELQSKRLVESINISLLTERKENFIEVRFRFRSFSAPVRSRKSFHHQHNFPETIIRFDPFVCCAHVFHFEDFVEDRPDCPGR
jgi:hypothetical protein